ncbi:hypothetical protein NLJ89_g6935 [Agrocybe chaxingu]|uniref:Uncharacterized protein n=1 Tax=Agrocybe chaxingu TaxID=84603 RepID=A0A9W8MVX5_9AGAR|nr:hypothetical protein NLJ89_g6935 [Agrocybe chaxingu]
MMISIQRSRQILIIWLLIEAAKIEQIAGQGVNGRFDILTGNNGESSCQLKDTIYRACNTTPPSLSDPQTPTLCTWQAKVLFPLREKSKLTPSRLPSNVVFFNICSSGINLDRSSSRAESGSIGITTPAWAGADVPGNGAIDLQKAVVLVHEAPKPWSTVQIILPIATSLATAVLFIVFLKLFGQRLSHFQWTWRRLFDIFRPVPKVKPVDKELLDNSWEIEPSGPPQPTGRQSFVVVDMPSPVDTTRDTEPAFRSVISSEPHAWSLEAQQGSLPSQSQDALPGGRVYPFGPSAAQQIQAQTLFAPQPVRPVPERSNSGDSSNSSGSGSWRLPGSLRNMHIPVPWKRRPVPVRQVPPTRRWRVDGPDSSSTEGSSNRHSASTQSGTRAGHSSRLSSGGVSTIEEHEEEGSLYRHSDDGEDSSLIPRQFHAERTSFLADRSSNTHSTSINSHIKIISPSVTTDSDTPRHTLIGSSKMPFNFPIQPPPIPPVPNHPAPPAPFVARKPTLRERDSEDFMFGQPINPAQHAMGIILEEQFSDSGRSIRGTPSPPAPLRPIQVPSSDFGRSSPAPNPQRIPSNEQPRSSGAIPAHISQQSFSISSPFSHSRGGSNERAALPTPPIQGAQHHIAKKPSTENPRPLPSPSSPPPNVTSFRLPQESLHSRDRSGSSAYSQISRKMSNDSDLSMYVDPFTPSSAHRRGLSADDTASFYLTPDPPARSVTPSRGDPVMLFPGAVRGAGYQGYAGMGEPF